MSDRVLINENELESVAGGRMKFSGGTMQMGYLHPDGKTVTIHPVLIKNIDDAYKRSLELHMETDDEDYILSVLIAENIVGPALPNA